MKEFVASPSISNEAYTNNIPLEELEEENPTVSLGYNLFQAYALLTKIEDPYYASKQPQTEYREEDKSNIHVYQSFYTHVHQKTGSQGFFLLIIIDFSTSSFDEDKKPLKSFPQRIFQEPKRHSSLKRNGGTLSPFAQEYVSQAHRPGVNTPPPGLQQYTEFPPYDLYSPYAVNGYAQGFSHPPYPNSGYLPIYMNYQGYQDPQGYYQPVKQTAGTPKKKSAKPSQFRPHLSAFGSKEVTFGQHSADNEEDIVTLINEFEGKEHDLLVLKGKITELVLTQTGSRFLQKQLTKSSPEFITFILEEVFV